MNAGFRYMIILLICFLFSLSLISCSEEDDDQGDSDSPGNGEDDDDDDDNDDNDDIDDDDDNDDDVVKPDDYLAPWPQNTIEPDDYDESPAAGDLRQKADDFDTWHLAHHQPDHGGTVDVNFTDGSHTIVESYSRLNDSCIWSGTYLGSQAMRYWATGSNEAKDNAIRTANALHGYLKVNGTTGFISRYWGSQSSPAYGGDTWCDNEDRCHRVDSGTYAGDFWMGETSRDQYTGWFFGLALAFDLIDDQDLKTMISDDVTEVLDTLLDHYWWILDEQGLPTDAAPNVINLFRVAWLALGYHITGNERFGAELRTWLLDENRYKIQLSSIAFLNRYGQYYGNNLSHTNFYNLLRIGRAYFSEEDFEFFSNLFNSQVHTFTRLSHNPWFNGIFMSQGPYEQGKTSDPYLYQLLEDLETTANPPHERYYLPDRDMATYTLDPTSVFLADLQAQFPFLKDLMGTFEYQAQGAFPVDQQCSVEFRFQKSPFKIYECGVNDPTTVYPGVDYLIGYWLAAYHRLINKSQ